MKKYLFAIFFLLTAVFAKAAVPIQSQYTRVEPVGYCVKSSDGDRGAILDFDDLVVTVSPTGVSAAQTNKAVKLSATLNRDYKIDYKIVCWQKFDNNPRQRELVPFEEFAQGSLTASIEYDAEKDWIYIVVVLKYDPVRTLKASISSFGSGTVSISPVKDIYFKGDQVTLTVQSNNGYQFIRWSDGNRDHVRTIVIDEDIDLKAFVEPKSSQVTFLPGEGAVLDVTTKRVSFDSVYGELPKPTLDGVTFKGWKDESQEEIKSDSLVKYTSDHTLTAVWEAKPNYYEVVFDANGGTGLATRVSQIFEVGVAQKLRINTFYYPNHAFVGWNQNSSAEEKQFSDEQVVSDLAHTGEQLTLFAIWRAEKIAYTVHFEKNADDATGTMADQQFAGGEEKPLNGCNFKREGWTFLGWSTDAKAVEATYQDREKVQDLTTEKSLTLYAVWTRNPVYSISYFAMKSDKEPWKTETVEQGKDYKLSDSNGLERIGYKLNEWKNGTNVYALKKVLTPQELAKMIGDSDDSIIFEADWQANEYTIVFDGNGGTCTVERKAMVYNELPQTISVHRISGVEPPQTTREGYELVGFSEDRLGTNGVIQIKSDNVFLNLTITNNLTTIDGAEVTLYAIWKKQSGPQPQPEDPLKNALGFSPDDPITVTANPSNCWTSAAGNAINITNDCSITFDATKTINVSIKIQGAKGSQVYYKIDDGKVSKMSYDTGDFVDLSKSISENQKITIYRGEIQEYKSNLKAVKCIKSE